MHSDANQPVSRWPHRWALALACATFPLVWVGGLVTTTDAGMAVLDWPSTYGYNLFLYPWTTWLAAPWDLFVEHGHRLLGATVGIMTIVLVALLWRSDERRWMRWLGVAALMLVIFQGVLGGMRVRLDERTLAMLHGCTGPLFFAVTVAIVVFTSKRWRVGANSSSNASWPTSAAPIRRLAAVTCILVYLQVVIGAVLRHVPAGADPATFAMAVRFHLFLAAIVTLHIAILVWLVLFRARSIKPLAGLATALGTLVMAQLLLGAGTWIVKFSVPAWASSVISTGSIAIQDGGWLQTHVITAHVAVGSLLLVASLALALYAQRLLPTSSSSQETLASRLGGRRMSRLSTATGIAALADAQTRRAWLARVADYVELTKPRIVAMELVTVIVAAHLASPWGVDRAALLLTVLGASLVAASAGALNQWWERATDARMPRTANRPLPAGRLTSRQVLVFGAATLILGMIVLVVGVNLIAAAMALATWLIYVLVYTPMKTRSPLNTAVGAASGALPILIGWTATGAAVDIRALAVVSVMFLWQFPHFMAIAWLYRADYARAGQRMLTVVDPTGLRAGAQAVVGALALIPVSLVPALAPQAGSPAIYCGWALVLGIAQVAAATMFLLHRNDHTARRLLRASLAYLICWMGLLLMVAV